MQLKIDDNSTLLMIGDSITDCDRDYPIGDGRLKGSLGHGYVNLVAGILRNVCPENGIRILNMGVSGNTVRDLSARWRRDVIDLSPDWVSIMIGINDVWGEMAPPAAPGLRVPIEVFETKLDELVAKTAPITRGLILMTPYLIESNRDEPMRAMMDRYGEVVKRLAKIHKALIVDTQAAFDDILPHYHPLELAVDRIHTNHIGHLAIARAFAQAISVANIDMAASPERENRKK